jgi:hypothetical protein
MAVSTGTPGFAGKEKALATERKCFCFFLEATGGFEPPNKAFAELCLTTWRRRRLENEIFYTLFAGCCQ